MCAAPDGAKLKWKLDHPLRVAGSAPSDAGNGEAADRPFGDGDDPELCFSSLAASL
jgi:hypothetical protein